MPRNLCGLVQCPTCKKFYSYDEKFSEALNDGCIGNDGYYMAVIVCACGEKRVAGGEHIGDGIMMFSHDFKSDRHDKIQSFDAVMLNECEEGDPDITAATYVGGSLYHKEPGKTIYLKPEA